MAGKETYAAAIAGIPMPAEIARLPLHPKFRMPLPWFCQQDPPDFRVIRPRAVGEAHRGKRCWITGESRYEKRLAFVTGPMCVITGTSAEPPSRPNPAIFAAQACPFLANPRMVRNDKDLPEGTVEPGGIMIRRNPGVAAVLITDSYRVMPDQTGMGVLFRMGPPREVLWFAQGRAATRAEVEASIESGLVQLREIAQQDGPEGLAALEECIAAARRWLPPEPQQDGKAA